MCRDMHVTQCISYIHFDPFGPVMALLYGPISGDQYVHHYESAAARLTSPQGMKGQALLAISA